jgi:hypothetical protein
MGLYADPLGGTAHSIDNARVLDPDRGGVG